MMKIELVRQDLLRLMFLLKLGQGHSEEFILVKDKLRRSYLSLPESCRETKIAKLAREIAGA